MDVLLRLGPYRFAVDTAAHQTLRRRAGFHWPAVPRLWNDPATQFTGAAPEEIALEGRIIPSFHGGLDQINTLRAMAREPIGSWDPQPLPLVTGWGEFLGEWSITEVEELQAHLQSRGAPGEQRFRLTLQRYVRDAA